MGACVLSQACKGKVPESLPHLSAIQFRRQWRLRQI
nr:MAG TPA: hypothetical protein [Caudoviricetes sp.]